LRILDLRSWGVAKAIDGSRDCNPGTIFQSRHFGISGLQSLDVSLSPASGIVSAAGSKGVTDRLWKRPGLASMTRSVWLLPVLRNQMTPLIIDYRVVLLRNILTPGHSVRVRGSIYFGGGSKYFVTPAQDRGHENEQHTQTRRRAVR